MTRVTNTIPSQREEQEAPQMTMMMKAVRFPGDRKVDVVERPVPQPGSGQVRIRTRASAICRSDMGLYTGASNIVGGDAARTGAITPGHEPAGVIDAVGEGVATSRIGERVAVHLGVGCGSCARCATGYTFLCAEWKCVGFDIDGGDADYLVVPSRNALLLPDSVSFVSGALMTDMIGSQYSTQKRMGIGAGQVVAVVGLGPMGGAAVLVARALGADVIALDPILERRALALELGAAEAIDAAEPDALDQVRRSTSGRGVDAAIDCSGNPAGQNLALDAAAVFGTVAFVGESRSTTINPSDQIIRKLLTVVGGWYFPITEWPEITDLVVASGMPIERLVTHTFSIDDAGRAFDLFDRRLTEKAVFVWDDRRSSSIPQPIER